MFLVLQSEVQYRRDCRLGNNTAQTAHNYKTPADKKEFCFLITRESQKLVFLFLFTGQVKVEK